MTYDNSCYEGEFAGITQLQGKVSIQSRFIREHFIRGFSSICV